MDNTEVNGTIDVSLERNNHSIESIKEMVYEAKFYWSKIRIMRTCVSIRNV
jgi:hypothetical protein